jgi:putative redox protein
MARKSATVALEGSGLRFSARAGSGHTIVMDDGTGDAGVRPAELIPVALAGCTAMDVISILRKKRQTVTRYEVNATGEQMDEAPHAFTRIDVVHVLEGPSLDVEAIRRAIELSATRYCAVGATLASGVTETHHHYVVRSGTDEKTGEAIVLGPNAGVAVPGRKGEARRSPTQ